MHGKRSTGTRWAVCSGKTCRSPWIHIAPPTSGRWPPRGPLCDARRSGHARRPSHTPQQWTTRWRCSRRPGRTAATA
eukprot:2183557-Pyramimonas_sp.AAC.1